jgi:hypothetical protein
MTRTKSTAGITTILLGAIFLGACSSAPTESEATTGAGALDTHPATIEDAKATAALLEERLAANPNDSETLAAQGAFHARLDELDRLVARIEPRAGHVVSFFDVGNGAVAIEETRPKDEPSVMAGLETSSPADVYRVLAGKEAPAAFAAFEPRLEGAKPAELAPGPAATSEEIEGSRAHAEGLIGFPLGPAFTCFTGGDFHSCQVPWSNGGYWDKNSKTSFFEILPLAPLYVSFTLSTGGGFFLSLAPNTVTNLWGYSPSYRTTTCSGNIFTGTTCVTTQDYDIVNHDWEIVNATGVTFDWSTEFRWNCSYTACNTP